MVSETIIDYWKNKLNLSPEEINKRLVELGDVPRNIKPIKNQSENDLSTKILSFRCDKEIVSGLKELFGGTRNKNKFINDSLRDAIHEEKIRKVKSIKQEAETLSLILK